MLYGFCPQGGDCNSVGSDGNGPIGGLIFDASGALYGTTWFGGNLGGDNGTVFKLTPPATPGRAWTETQLYGFGHNGSGASPQGSLIFDASGALYGTTFVGGLQGCGGADRSCGTVFELSGVGVPLSKNPQTADFDDAGRSDILLQNTDGAADIWEMNGTKVIAKGSPGNPGGVAGDRGRLFLGQSSDCRYILWQNSNGAVQIWQMNGWKKVGGGAVGNPGTAWGTAIGTGDFNGDSKSDILVSEQQRAPWRSGR